ncbi:hypothetical protein [Undibacterium sp. TS12]|uniref:hypothetical protein n=1 Tax=Undibacterium sp. TS12 TaxID=2908202 RepID=UPI001F4CA7F0|nr:hypothetical protein [Undibacterium sp. TS12]MCH8621259.1 hypothetical protein [Undibacterium sp. TS12]
MNKLILFFLSISVLGGLYGPVQAEEKKKNPIPEIREPLDDKRSQLLIVLATDLMFVRHFAADRQFKLKELEINVSLQPFNEKQKELFAIRKKQMDECVKEAGSIQANFFTAFDQLNAAKYEVSDYKAVYAYAKKNTNDFQRKDLMQPAELKAYEESRPQGFTFRSVCIDDGVAPKLKEKTEFVSPNAVPKK